MPVGSTASLSDHVQLHSALKNVESTSSFLVNLKKSAPKTFQILSESYGNETLSCAHVFEWHKRFSGVINSVEDDEPAGRPR
ncbi:hypothetical protein TNCV_1105351 [Trichonephila clavipes]|nr:hypothetical protein TNCV_1105351 [Trichonephila clavipes]